MTAEDPREIEFCEHVNAIARAAEALGNLGWNRMHDATPFDHDGYRFLVLWCWLDEEKTRIGWFVEYLFSEPFYISLEFARDGAKVVEAARAGWEALLGAPVDAVRTAKCGERVYLVMRRPEGA